MPRLTKKRIAAGIAALIVASWLIPVYGDICEKNPYTGQKDCASYHIATVILWQIGEFLNYYGVAITAISTAFIGLFTYTLYKTTSAQARLTRDSIDLARQEFIATHRPRLRVRRFRAHLNEGQPVKISYLVTNVGDSPAHVKGIDTKIGVCTVNGEELYDTPEIGEERRIKPGESRLYVTVALKLLYDDAWGVTEYVQAWVAVRGTIEYTDDNGVERSTGFWRRREAISGEFRAKDDPDYEYED